MFFSCENGLHLDCFIFSRIPIKTIKYKGLPYIQLFTCEICKSANCKIVIIKNTIFYSCFKKTFSKKNNKSYFACSRCLKQLNGLLCRKCNRMGNKGIYCRTCGNLKYNVYRCTCN